MAGEYSRELSAKVFAGQCRLIELGYRQGGPPGFGLRRQLIDQSGQSKGALSRGEHKSLQTDRVVLVPGPLEELKTVQRIYRAFVEQQKTENEIASILNAEGVLTDLQRPWSCGTVHQILINEKYVGNNVWNRSSFKLKKKHVRNNPDIWIRAEGVFEPIVERGLFDAAQAIIGRRSHRLSDADMLGALREILQDRGYLSGFIIDEAGHLPSSSAYQCRFGSLLRAYHLVGYTPNRDFRYIEINRYLRSLYPNIIADVVESIADIGGQVTRHPETDLLALNGEFTASIVIVRCRETAAGAMRWQVRFDTGLSPDITIAVRMDRANRNALDYYLLPRIDMTGPRLRLAEDNGISLDCYRFASLEPLFAMAGRVSILELAA